MKKIITSKQLLAAGLIKDEQEPELAAVTEKYALGLSPQILASWQEPAIRTQFMPSTKELQSKPWELTDPIGDAPKQAVPGVIHRYPDRVLLQALQSCPIYCRFCFRREVVGHGQKLLSEDGLERAFEYIAANTEIWEVILSGGDPLMLKPARLQQIFARLQAIPHVGVVRIHSRVPVLDSARINREMLEVLAQIKPLYIVLHINHSAEFNEQAVKTIDSLHAAGVVLLGQTVLLRGVNDSTEAMAALFKKMIMHRIKPYYLHHPDLAAGTSHFYVPIARGQEIMKQLQGRHSGICLPTYVLDIPGGHGKAPIGPNYLVQTDNGYLVKDYSDQQHFYCTN